jgi:hypothetical protein
VAAGGATALVVTLAPATFADPPPTETQVDALAKCESLTATGPRPVAIEACRRASPGASSPVAARALVRALMSGPEQPTVEELAQAFLLAQEVRSRFPDQPWGYAALCDIAERIGDQAMWQNYARELERVAPTHPEAKRALKFTGERRPSWLLWAGWLSIAVASLGTLVHFLWRIVRRVPRRGRIAVAAALVLVGAVCAAPERAFAEPSVDHPERVSNWPIDDRDPEGSIPTAAQRNRNPIEFGYWLQDLAFKASSAAKRGDHPLAIKYYRAMAKAVPDMAVSFSRLCDEYEATGDIEHAIASCNAALQLTGVKLKDFIHFLQLMVIKPGKLSTEDETLVWSVLDHLKSEPNARSVYNELECEIAVKVDHFDKLKECTTALAATASFAPSTILYEWTLAMKQKDYKGARSIIEHGQRVGVNPESIARMQKETDAEVAHGRNKIVLSILGLLLSLGAAVTGVVLLVRRRSPPAPPVSPAVSPATASP